MTRAPKEKRWREQSDYAQADVGEFGERDGYGSDNFAGRGAKLQLQTWWELYVYPDGRRVPVLRLGTRKITSDEVTALYEEDRLVKREFPSDTPIVYPPNNPLGLTHLEMVARAAVGREKEHQPNEQAAA